VEVGPVDEGVRKAKGNGCEAFAFVSHVTAEGVRPACPAPLLVFVFASFLRVSTILRRV
jgi:hypothetical protein